MRHQNTFLTASSLMITHATEESKLIIIIAREVCIACKFEEGVPQPLNNRSHLQGYIYSLYDNVAIDVAVVLRAVMVCMYA